MDTLKLTLCQTELHYEDIGKNLKMFSGIIESIDEPTDIVILPEMFTTSFSLNTSLAEPMQGRSLQWMLRQAEKRRALIIGSIIVSENGEFHNRLIAAFPDGTYKSYDKRHLVPLFGEDTAYKPGTDRLVFEYKGWKICPFICYDLRFPVWARNTVGYDLLIYVANWPTPRSRAWDTLLRARAIENVSYVAGVNRVGFDDDGQEYFGHSGVFDCLGKEISAIPKSEEHIVTVEIDKQELSRTRERLPFLQSMDDGDILQKVVYRNQT